MLQRSDDSLTKRRDKLLESKIKIDTPAAVAKYKLGTMSLMYKRLSCWLWRSKYPLRNLLVGVFFTGLVLFLLFGTLFEVYKAIEREKWKQMFPDQLSPLNYKPEMNGASVAMNDLRLIAYLREEYLVPPPRRPPLQESENSPSAPAGYVAHILDAVKGKKNGFFVDCGASDGVTRSTTLILESSLEWTGLLIEPNHSNFKTLKARNRNAYLSPACVSDRSYPRVVSFLQNGTAGRITQWPIGGRHRHHVDIQCFPLFSYFLAMNEMAIDFLNLDIGGYELEVLKTIPWEGVQIQTVSVGTDSEAMDLKIERYLKARGYYVHTREYYIDNNLRPGKRQTSAILFVMSTI